jgi:hypothetical protein
MKLAPLGTLRLAYRGPFVLVRPHDGDGFGYGEGEGSLEGERVRGTIRWSNHPRRRLDGTFLPNVFGHLATHDGADVLFHMTGRTTFVDGVGQQNLVLLFEAADERYLWLERIVCVAEGTIDMATKAMRAELYACTPDATS